MGFVVTALSALLWFGAIVVSVIDVGGVAAVPIFLLSMATDCGEVSRGNVTRVRRVDAFCDVTVTVPWPPNEAGLELKGVACSSVRQCVKRGCVDVLFRHNRFFRRKCERLVFSREDLPDTPAYADLVIGIQVVVACWTVTSVAFVLSVVFRDRVSAFLYPPNSRERVSTRPFTKIPVQAAAPVTAHDAGWTHVGAEV